MIWKGERGGEAGVWTGAGLGRLGEGDPRGRTGAEGAVLLPTGSAGAHPRADVAGSASESEAAGSIASRLGSRSIVLVGMMGVGKTTVGRRLAARLGLPFSDADAEIERAAGQTVSEIFAEHGEAYFRGGERRVIARLLATGPRVLATGGGAFLDPATREAVAAHGVSVWLRADFDVLMPRLRRRKTRPLLRTPDPEATVRALLAAREPIYALADVAVPSRNEPHERVVDAVAAALGPALDDVEARDRAAPGAPAQPPG